MRKLKLDVNAVQVDTFVLGHDGAQRFGTVQGAAMPVPGQAPPSQVQLDTADEHTCGAVNCINTYDCTNTCTDATGYYGTCYTTNDPQSGVWSCQPDCPATSAFTCPQP